MLISFGGGQTNLENIHGGGRLFGPPNEEILENQLLILNAFSQNSRRLDIWYLYHEKCIFYFLFLNYVHSVNFRFFITTVNPLHRKKTSSLKRKYSLLLLNMWHTLKNYIRVIVITIKPDGAQRYKSFI